MGRGHGQHRLPAVAPAKHEVPVAAIIERIQARLTAMRQETYPMWMPRDRAYGPGKLRHIGAGPGRILLEWAEPPDETFLRVWGRGFDLHFTSIDNGVLAEFERAADAVEALAAGGQAVLEMPIVRRAQQIQAYDEELRVPEHIPHGAPRRGRRCADGPVHRHVTETRPHRKRPYKGLTAVEVSITCRTPGCAREGERLHHYDLDGFASTADEQEVTAMLLSASIAFRRDWCTACGNLGVISFHERGYPHAAYR